MMDRWDSVQFKVADLTHVEDMLLKRDSGEGDALLQTIKDR